MCMPVVDYHGYFTDSSPPYNALGGPYVPASCSSPRLIVGAHRSVVITVLAPFATAGPEDYPRAYMHAGSWDVFVSDWPGVSLPILNTKITCDPTACKKGPGASPSPSPTPMPTSSPSASTASH
jgi:hypothetical protein